MILKGLAPAARLQFNTPSSSSVLIYTYIVQRRRMNGAGSIYARGSEAESATILCSIPLYCCNSSAIRAAGFQKLFHTIEKRS